MEKFLKFMMTLFAMLVCTSGQATEVTVSFDPTQDQATEEQPYSFTKDGITLAVEIVTTGFSATDICLRNNQNYRVYAGQTLTISSSKGRITNIVFTCNDKNSKQLGLNHFEPQEDDLKNYYSSTKTKNKGKFSYSQGISTIIFYAESEVIINSMTVTYDDALPVNAPTTLTLDGNSSETDNSSAIQNAYNSSVDVTLQRQFTNDGGWYTLCLPFSLSQDQLKTAFGDNMEIDQFLSVTKNGELSTLNFSPLTESTIAGCPYLIKPSKTTDESITFNSVTISSNSPLTVEKDGVQFVGIYNATTIPIDNKTCFLSGTDGLSLVYSNNLMSKLKGTRAYFVLNATATNAKVMVDVDPSTGIRKVEAEGACPEAEYSLTGHRLPTLPRHPGIVIRNGKKIIIR